MLRATSLRVLLFLHSIALTRAAVKAGDKVYLRVKETGACITVESYNGEARSTSVHAQYWHHGLWQELRLTKDGGNESGEVLSGDTINLLGHNGNWIEANGSKLQAVHEVSPSEGLVIETESGDGPVSIGDTVYLKAPSGQYVSVNGMDVSANSAGKGAEQAFVIDTHMVGTYDGRWTREKDPGADVFVIQGSTLHFVDDIEFGMFPQGKNKFTTGLQGWLAHDAGELADGKIVWSNGDVWIPTEGAFDGRWTPREDPGSKIFNIKGGTLKVVGGAESEVTAVSNDTFTTAEATAPDKQATLVGIDLHWGNGDVWVPLAAGRFDGRWTAKANPRGDFFDIEGDMLFFDAGLESRIVPNGTSFTTELEGHAAHVQATLSEDGQELQWNNQDVWTRFHKGRDFWVPASIFTTVDTTASSTTTATTMTTVTRTTTMTTMTTSMTVTTTTVTTVTITTTMTTMTTSTTVTTATVTTITTITTATTVTTTQVPTTATTTMAAVGTTLQITTATTTVAAVGTTLQAINGTAGGATSPTDGPCFEQRVAYEPLDMDNASASYENTALDCQKRCQRTPGCTHFTYWFLVTPGHCHLQDVYALHSGFRLGFVAGPATCYQNVSKASHNRMVKLNQPEVGNQTYVPYAYRCLRMSRMYSPIMHSEFLTRKKGYKKGRQAVKGCRELCLKTEGCFYYSIGFPTRLCSLSPKNAHEVKYIIKHISGPVSCDVEDQEEQLSNGPQDAAGNFSNASNSSNVSNAIKEFLELQDLEANATGRQLGLAPLLGGLGACFCAALVALVVLKRTSRWRHGSAEKGTASKRMARLAPQQERSDEFALLAEEDTSGTDGFVE